MAATTHELMYRNSNGIHVSLLWSALTDRVTVAVADEPAGESFELDVPPRLALDAFNHPYAYASRRTAEAASEHRRLRALQR